MTAFFTTINLYTTLVSLWLTLVFLIYRIISSYHKKQLEIPIAGAKEREWFPGVRAAWRNAWDSKTAGWQAWEHYGSKGKACVFPAIIGADLVLLPHSELSWMIEQPETILGHKEDLSDSWLLKHTFMTRGITENPIHEKVLSGKFTGHLGNLISELMTSIEDSITQTLGCKTDVWKEVPIESTVRALAAKSISIALLGEDMGSDRRIQDNGLAFAVDMMVSVALLQLVWKPLRPLVALLLTLPNRIHSNAFHRVLRPGIQRRVQRYQSRLGPAMGKQESQALPADLLEFLIHQGKQLEDPWFCEPDTLAARILILNFAAVFTSTFAMTHAILDLTHYSKNHIEALRTEIIEVLTAHNGRWSKHALADLVLLDSFMRESQRMNSLVTMAVRRRVLHPSGVTTPSGIHVPAGSTVATYILPILFDSAIYPDAFEFKPFRFAQLRAKLEGAQTAGQTWASTSTKYLTWGHGRHACPGRFFASTSIKLHLAYLILNYDFKMRLVERPPNKWFGLAQMPPRNVTMRIRRRNI